MEGIDSDLADLMRNIGDRIDEIPMDWLSDIPRWVINDTHAAMGKLLEHPEAKAMHKNVRRRTCWNRGGA